MSALWITILVVGVATYATRVFPLFWLQPNGEHKMQSSWLNHLGPCLLAAMAVAVILPTFTQPKGTLNALAASVGLIASGGSMWLRRDPGLATVIGMITFYVISS